MQFDRDDGDDRSSDDLDLSFDFQEAEGDDRKARDEDQDSWDKEQGAGEAADEPGISQFVPLQCVLNFDDIFELRTRRGLYYFQKLSFSTKTNIWSWSFLQHDAMYIFWYYH